MAYSRAELGGPTATADAADVDCLDVDALFRRHAGFVASIGYRLLGRDDEVDDLVQDVFIDTVRGIGTLRDPEAVKGWLATLTVRAARKRIRRRRRRTFFVRLDDALCEGVATQDASPEDRALLARVYATLDRVPVEGRLAWILKHVEGESLEVVAQRCECSLATAKRRIAKTHAIIRKAVYGG